MYAHLEDLSGTLQCLSKKKYAAKWSGDDAAAAQASEMYEKVLSTGELAGCFLKSEEQDGMEYT